MAGVRHVSPCADAALLSRCAGLRRSARWLVRSAAPLPHALPRGQGVNGWDACNNAPLSHLCLPLLGFPSHTPPATWIGSASMSARSATTGSPRPSSATMPVLATVRCRMPSSSRVALRGAGQGGGFLRMALIRQGGTAKSPGSWRQAQGQVRHSMPLSLAAVCSRGERRGNDPAGQGRRGSVQLALVWSGHVVAAGCGVRTSRDGWSPSPRTRALGWHAAVCEEATGRIPLG